MADLIAASQPLEPSLHPKQDPSPTFHEAKPKSLPGFVTLLPFMLTGATFILTFCFQIYQERIRTDAQSETEWRKALEEVGATDPSGSTKAAFEIESYLDSPDHGGQARAIAASLLPNVNNKFEFDELFTQLLKGTTQQNQNQLINIDALISAQLRDDYVSALRNPPQGGLPTDHKFGTFLEHPDRFYDGTNGSAQIDDVLTKAWELDSVTEGLKEIWTNGTKSGKVTPAKEDLDDCVFFNYDFSAIDFRAAESMANVQFDGTCAVVSGNLPKDVINGCHAKTSD